MENAMAIAKILGPVYLLMGLSVLLYAKSWQKLMTKWEKDHLSLFPLMFVYPILGLLIIGMYNVWEWNIWLIVTLAGWIMLIKGAFYFLLPGSALKSMMKMKANTGLLYVAGLVALVIGAALTYNVYMVAQAVV